VSELLFETDLFASHPVYYNEATGIASRNVNDVIEFGDLELDPEGFNAYLGAGYSLFQQTPVRGVRFLPPSARLWRDAGGRLRVEEVPVDLDARLERRFTEDEVIDLLRARVQAAESAHEGEIVIPTSGGFDSRLLNLMISEPSRIRSFTFGPTSRQWDSTEVARARALAVKLGSRWERIPIAPFHSRLDEWDRAFGPVVHAHGMYQMEFYSAVRSRLTGGELVLSGLGGDGLAGKVDALAALPLSGPGDVVRLIQPGVMHADPSASVIPHHGTLQEEYFEGHREILSSPRRRVIEAVRFRIMLTHYLLRVPGLYGLADDAPFLDVDVATAMLSLPDERRSRRRWVREYLSSRGALFEEIRGDSRYWLYWPVMRAQPLPPLDAGLLAEAVLPDYVHWVNRTLSWRGSWCEGFERVRHRPGLRRAVARLEALGLRQRRLEAYHAYMTLRPIQRLLQKRDDARRGVPAAAGSIPKA
jgi:asparagine synthetase B (glutamine-hydrolysing)